MTLLECRSKKGRGRSYYVKYLLAQDAGVDLGGTWCRVGLRRGEKEGEKGKSPETKKAWRIGATGGEKKH